MKKLLLIIFSLFFISLLKSPPALAIIGGGGNNGGYGNASCQNRGGNPPTCWRYATSTCVNGAGNSCTPGSPGCNCTFNCFGGGGLSGGQKCASCGYNQSQNQCSSGSANCASFINNNTCLCMTNTCKWVSTCQPSTVNCNLNNKCNSWSRGCGKTTDCGGCNNNQYCKSNSASGTNNGGNCAPKPQTCTPKTCAQLGVNGTQGAACGNQRDDGCGNPINCSTNCNGDLSCTGRNNNGYGGKCTPKNNPSPTATPPNTIDVIVFYDNAHKATMSSYNVCYPAVNPTNKPPVNPNSGNVSVTVNSGDTGVPTTTYAGKSYSNCRTNGGNTSSRGFIIRRTDNSKSIKMAIPSGYAATGYNYVVDGKAQVTCLPSSKAKGCSGLANSTPYLNGQDIVVRFGFVKTSNPPPTSQISGLVFIDKDQNDQFSPNGNGEECFDSTQYGDLTIVNGGTNRTFTETTDCTPFSYDNSGATKLNVPNGFYATGFEYQDATGNCASGDGIPDPNTNWCKHDSASTDTQESITLSGEAQVHFGLKQLVQTYSITGTIFTDSPPLGTMEGSDSPYKIAEPKEISAYPIDDSGQVSANPIQSSINGNNGYSLTNLNSGVYLIEYAGPNGNGPPSGYTPTYPNDGSIPPTIKVQIGNSGCWITSPDNQGKTINGARCSSGNIINLNFGINNTAQAWYQTVGGDMRIDSDLTDPIPSGAGLYASANLASPATEPGILFTGKPSASLTNLGNSQSAKASSKGWLSVSNPYKAVSGGTRLSYTYLNNVITRGGISPLALFTGGNNNNPPCGAGSNKPNCAFPSSGSSTFPAGVYTGGNGNVTGFTITSPYTFTSGNYIFLINGDLTIKGNITVNPGATAIFAVNGNVIVDPSVTNIDGVYSAEGKFDTGTCSGSAATCALTVNGSVIANAAGDVPYNTVSTVFNNGRSITTNSTTPSVTFKLRPDFLINMPETIKVPNYVIQEVAPGPAFTFGTSQGSVTPTPSFTPTPTPTLTPTPTPTPAIVPAYYDTVAGVVNAGKFTMVAERPEVLSAGTADSAGATHKWALSTTQGGYTGSGYITTPTSTSAPFSAPGFTANNAKCGGGTSAEVDYPFYVSAADIAQANSDNNNTPLFWAFFKIYGPDGGGSHDRFVVGVDCTKWSLPITWSSTTGWVWAANDTSYTSSNQLPSQNRFTISTPGIHYLQVWEKDDAVKIDRILLKTGSSFPGTPTDSDWH